MMVHLLSGFDWKEALGFSLNKWKISILPLVAAAILFQAFRLNPVLVFAVSALALIPLASLIGQATEELAGHVGVTLGGFLNATLGNITELIFGIVALWGGQTEIVKASITGSIIGNLLLVFGLAAFVGGIGRERLRFSQFASGANLSMLFLAVVALVMPAIFQLSVFGSLEATGARIERLSLWTAAVLLLSYLGSLVFVFRTHRGLFRVERASPPRIRKGSALAALVVATALTAVTTEVLVSQVGAATHALGWTDLFVGIVIVATVGNATEHSSAIMMARHDQMELAFNVAIGSSTQIALFVAPLLVVISQFRPAALSLVFHPLEIAAIILSVGAVALVAMDGETHWFEGLQLLGVYIILVVFFYYLPA
ncbi:MAG: calcium/proton exchanger [Candidatus Acidiferrales bacterium]